MKPKAIIQDFLDLVQKMPQKSSFPKLQACFLNLSKLKLEEAEADIVMEGILTYIDVVINISAKRGYKDQIKICKQWFDVLQDFITDNICNHFVKRVTQKVFDILIEEDVNSWCVKKHFLLMFVTCIQDVPKAMRCKIVQDLPDIYLFKIVDSISTYGDYDFQAALIELVFRMYGKSVVVSKLPALIPESQELIKSFANISGETFDEDVRKFLNALNENTKKVFSIVCTAVFLGNVKCGEPMANVDGLWVDFNRSENAVSWYCSEESLVAEEDRNGSESGWNLVTFFVTDVETIRILRPPKSEDAVIYVKLRSCCTSSCDSSIVKGAGEVKFVVRHGTPCTKTLIAHVLPAMFKQKFQHNTPKLSLSKKSVYKPLSLTTYRKSKSESSRSKSDLSGFTARLEPKRLLSVSSGCEVISVSDGISERASEHRNVESQYETAQICPLKQVGETSPVFSEPGKQITILSGRCSGSKAEFNKGETRGGLSEDSERFETAPDLPNGFRASEAGLPRNANVKEEKRSSSEYFKATQSRHVEEIPLVDVLEGRNTGLSPQNEADPPRSRHSSTLESPPKKNEAPNVLKEEKRSDSFVKCSSSGEFRTTPARKPEHVPVFKDSEQFESIPLEDVLEHFKNTPRNTVAEEERPVEENEREESLPDVEESPVDAEAEEANVEEEKGAESEDKDVPEENEGAVEENKAVPEEDVAVEEENEVVPQENVGVEEEKGVRIEDKAVPEQNVEDYEEILVLFDTEELLPDVLATEAELTSKRVEEKRKEEILRSEQEEIVLEPPKGVVPATNEDQAPNKVAPKSKITDKKKPQTKPPKRTKKRLVRKNEKCGSDKENLRDLQEESSKNEVTPGKKHLTNVNKANRVVPEEKTTVQANNSIEVPNQVVEPVVAAPKTLEDVPKEENCVVLLEKCSERYKKDLNSSGASEEFRVRSKKKKQQSALVDEDEEGPEEANIVQPTSEEEDTAKKILSEAFPQKKTKNSKKIVLKRRFFGLETQKNRHSTEKAQNLPLEGSNQESLPAIEVSKSIQIDRQEKMGSKKRDCNSKVRKNQRNSKEILNLPLKDSNQEDLPAVEVFKSVQTDREEKMGAKKRNSNSKIKEIRLSFEKSPNLLLQDSNQEDLPAIEAFKSISSQEEKIVSKKKDLDSKTKKIRLSFEETPNLPPEDSNQADFPAIADNKTSKCDEELVKPCVVLLPRDVGLEERGETSSSESYENNAEKPTDTKSLNEAELMRQISNDSDFERKKKKLVRMLSASTTENDTEKPVLNCEKSFDDLRREKPVEIDPSNANAYSQETVKHVCEIPRANEAEKVEKQPETNEVEDMPKMKTVLDQTLSTARGGRRQRKLYDPSDLSHLESITYVDEEPEQPEVPKKIDLDKSKCKKQQKNTIKHSNKLKEVRLNSYHDRDVSKFGSTFYEILDSFRKEANLTFTSNPVAKSEPTKTRDPRKTLAKKNAAKQLKRINAGVKPAVMRHRAEESDMSEASLKLRKRRNSNDSPLMEIDKEASPPLEPRNKIKILSHIKITPKGTLLEDLNGVPKKKKRISKNPAEETPIVAENITNQEICHWIESGSPNYRSQSVSERRVLLKHCYPMFRSALGRADGSEEYKDLLHICKRLKKYI